MRFKVFLSKKSIKHIEKMPAKIKDLMALLVDDLEAEGPVQKHWSNYSKLSENEYHCHLSHHWVACWRNEKKSIIIEVYYAGSRENAPY